MSTKNQIRERRSVQNSQKNLNSLLDIGFSLTKSITSWEEKDRKRWSNLAYEYTDWWFKISVVLLALVVFTDIDPVRVLKFWTPMTVALAILRYKVINYIFPSRKIEQ